MESMDEVGAEVVLPVAGRVASLYVPCIDVSSIRSCASRGPSEGLYTYSGWGGETSQLNEGWEE